LPHPAGHPLLIWYDDPVWPLLIIERFSVFHLSKRLILEKNQPRSQKPALSEAEGDPFSASFCMSG
jgi:hypothetical protein